MPELYLPETETFDYHNITLIPQKCVVKSRSETKVEAKLGKHVFALPVIPANMSTVVDEETCKWLAKQNMFYVMHRFNVDPLNFANTMRSEGLIVSISLGIKKEDYLIVDRFVEQNNLTPDYITIDVAHGDSSEVLKMVEYVNKKLPNTYIIAGNIITVAAAERLIAAGASAIKVGVGPGLACTTAPNTGFGSQGWQLSAVANIAKKLKQYSVQIIADGGIREYGDIAKSIAFGADMVMIGGMFAGHDENPGDVIEETEGVFKKAFFGSASEHQKGEHKHVEGKKLFVPYKGSLSNTLRIIKENLQSSVSYAGGKVLTDLRKTKFVIRK